MSYIELENVNKFYSLGETKIHGLKDFSLSINQGEFLIISGPSGAGKTTLLNLIGGMDIPSNGKIIADKIQVHTLSEKWLTEYRRKKIGFIFQFFNLLSSYSALENVMHAVELIGVPTSNGRNFSGRVIKKHCKDVLKSVGLEERMNHYPHQLSGGEQQRVAIARAIAKDCPIVLADEPTGNIDYRIGKKVLSLMQKLSQERERALVLVTHNPAIEKIGNRVVRISSGSIIDQFQQDPINAENLFW